MMLEPMVEVYSKDGTKEVPIITKLYSDRKIFLQGKVTNDLIMSVMRQIMYLQKENNDPIYLYISSPGGSVDDGLLLYDLIKQSKCPIYTICCGMAASMGAVLLAAGDKGHRYIYPHSKVMIHEPLLSNGVGGSATSIANIAESILETKKIINSLLAKDTGKSIKIINKATSYDNFMQAEDAINFGIVDQIVNF